MFTHDRHAADIALLTNDVPSEAKTCVDIARCLNLARWPEYGSEAFVCLAPNNRWEVRTRSRFRIIFTKVGIIFNDDVNVRNSRLKLYTTATYIDIAVEFSRFCYEILG